MGGDSSSSSSTENYTDNSRETRIEDRRASATDSAVSVTGDRSTVVKENIAPDVAREAFQAARRAFTDASGEAADTSQRAIQANEDVSETAIQSNAGVLSEAIDFAEFTQGGLQDATGDAIQVATEEATDDAKEIVSEFGRYGLLAGVAVTAIIVIWGNRS